MEQSKDYLIGGSSQRARHTVAVLSGSMNDVKLKPNAQSAKLARTRIANKNADLDDGDGDNVIHFSRDQITHTNRNGRLARSSKETDTIELKGDVLGLDTGAISKSKSFKVPGRKSLKNRSSKEEINLNHGLNDREMKEWIWLQTKIQYNEEAAKSYSSLKNVLKRRH